MERQPGPADFDFASWGQPAASAIGWGFRLLGTEIPGWTPHRLQIIDLPGEPRANLSVWRPEMATGQRIAVNIYECDSARAARVQLLRRLGDVREPGLRRVETPGDVAFTVGFTARLFVRDNHVAVIRSLEAALAPIESIAVAIDRFLAGVMPAPGGRPPELRTLAAGSMPLLGEPVPLRIDAIDETGPAWVRLDSPAGSLRIENGAPVYVPSAPGEQTINVHVSGSRGALDRTLRLDISAPGTKL